MVGRKRSRCGSSIEKHNGGGKDGCDILYSEGGPEVHKGVRMYKGGGTE